MHYCRLLKNLLPMAAATKDLKVNPQILLGLVSFIIRYKANQIAE